MAFCIAFSSIATITIVCKEQINMTTDTCIVFSLCFPYFTCRRVGVCMYIYV